ncbi:MAG: hypothetical protein GEU81_12050 [Nitriliruptorales bacterium]|nr:hypothetical protein [Nitriliruptorales bacterium]
MDTTTSPPPGFAPAGEPEDDLTPSIARRGAVLTVVAVVLVIAGFAALLVGFRVARAGALPGMRVGELRVGGLDEAELTSALESYEARRGSQAVTVIRPATPDDPRGEAALQATAADLGYSLDVEAVAEAVLARGRQANPFAALADHFRAFGGTIRVDPVEEVDPETLDAWVEQTITELELPPREGTVEFEGATVQRVEPVPGIRVDAEQLASDAAQAATAQGDATLTIRTAPVESQITAEHLDALYAKAQLAVSAPVSLARGDAALTLSPEDLGAVLQVEPPGDGGAPDLTVDPAALDDRVDPSPVEAAPVDATFRLEGGSVQVVEGRPGFVFDAEKAAAQVLELATSEGERSAAIEGTEVAPERTTEDAEALSITQQVSTFTTGHPCCASRVHNIHRVADLLRGVVIVPGETFSLNEFVGPRTEEKGFLPGGAIFEGEFVEEVGGGVSQFATTMFNAAFLGGYAIPEHKPHSQYISRYPEGREATLNYPNVDLKVRNNSPHGIYIDTAYTDESITVTFYGTPWVEVDTRTGSRTDVTEPETIVRTTDELPPGEERVVQEAEGEGFDVRVVRELRYPDGRAEEEEFFTRYVARPEIIERGEGGEPSP